MTVDLTDLRSDPLYVKVYTLLKGWILSGRLSPGEAIGETALAAELHVSRTPVRDALRRLEQDRLIVPVPGAAYEVYQPTLQDVEDLYLARAVLEGGAARLAAERQPDPAVEEMEAILEQMRSAYGAQPQDQLLDLDTQFHERLIVASGNPVLVELHNHLSIRLRHLRAMGGDVSVRRQQVLDHHAAILEAIRSGNGAEAEEITRTHILSVYQAVLASLQERLSLNR